MQQNTDANLISNCRFYIQPLIPTCADQCSSLLARKFIQNGYNKAFGIDYKIAKQYIDAIVPLGIKRGLSIVAREKTTKNVAAVMINYDMFDQKFIDLNGMHQNCQKLACFIDAVQDQSTAAHASVEIPGKYVKFSLIAVKDEFMGQKLVKFIGLQGFKLIKQKGYEQLSTQFTHPATIKVFEKQLKLTKRIKSLKFEDFQYKDQKLLKHLKEQIISLSLCKLNDIDIRPSL